MLKELKGDILLSNAEMIAHSVAPMDHFDSGLALSLRERYPSMVKDFRHYCHSHNPKTGEIFHWAGADKKRIVSLMAQEPAESKHTHSHPGSASLSNLDTALKNLGKLISSEKIKSVAIPRLATGVGGLDWKDVLNSIQNHLSKLDADVYVYSTYVKDLKGEE